MMGARRAMAVWSGATKLKGTLARPLFCGLKSDYFFFLPPFFLPPFFFVAIFLFSLFHYSWMCGSKRKTAIDDCIDSLKIEVKQKIDDHLGSGLEQRLTSGVPRSHILPYFVKR